MSFKAFFSKYGAYILAVVLFVILGYVYCKPELQGKVLTSSDDINGLAAVQDAAKVDPADGEYGWWNASMFSGMPNYQIGGNRYHSDALIRPFKAFLHRGPLHPAWIIIFYLICFFALLRSFGVDKWLSIVGAIAIALSSYFIVIIAAGHGGKTISISYMVLVAAGLYLIFRKKYGLGVIFTMFFTAMGFSMHPQMAYYILLMIGLFYCAELWIHIREKRWKDLLVGTALFVAALGIGFGTGTSNIFANAEYAEQTMRGGHSDLEEGAQQGGGSGLDIAYATQWSYGIDETLSFLIPGFKGGTSNASLGKKSDVYNALTEHGIAPRAAADFCKNVPLYWGEQPFTAGNVYMGAIVCFLFLLGCLIVRGPYKWALVASTLFSVLLAWGSNFMWLTELFFKYFPMYDKFRAVSSILIVAEIAMPLLGFLALKEIVEGNVEKKRLLRCLGISGAITSGICLLFWLLGGSIFSFTSSYDAAWSASLPDWLYAAIVEERAKLLRQDSLRSLLFIFGAAAVIRPFIQGKLEKKWMIAALGVLILCDMWPVDRRYFNDDNFVSVTRKADPFEMQPYEQAILQDQDPHFRVYNLCNSPFNEARTSYYLKSIGGYHAAKLRRYQDLISAHLAEMHMPVINMLNAKYLVVPGEGGSPQPQLNPGALGNAWFVSDILVADGAQAESDALMEVDLARTAVVGADFAASVPDLHPGIAPDASVALTKFHPRFIDYTYSSSTPGTLVFSEIYYPYGWKATIDGTPVEHFRADYTLRALNVPAGTHAIHFEFDPDSVRKGDTVATVCILLMYLVMAGFIAAAVVRRVKRRKAEQDA